MTPPRVALIGVSGYAKIYLHLLREAHAVGQVRVAAAAVINPAEEALAVAELRSWGATLYADWGAMIEAERGRIDLCLVPTGIQWHARMTIAALRAGMNVLVEKPLAGSSEDVAAIRRAEAETGRWVAVGFQDIYCPEARWMKQQLCSGAIGRLQRVRMLGLWPRPVSYFARNQWAGRLQAEGAAVLDSPLNNAFAHFVNLGLFFAGPAPHLSTSAIPDHVQLLRAHAIETFDTAVVTAHTPEGVGFWCGFSHACRQTREPEIYLEGTAGRAEWRHEQVCVVAPAGAPAIERPLPETTVPRQAMLAAVLARFGDAATPVCDTVMAAHHTAFIEAVHRTGETRPVAPEHIEWTSGDPQQRIPTIRGLEAALDQALRLGSPFTDVPFLPSAPAVR